jgi:hypothetical protein
MIMPAARELSVSLPAFDHGAVIAALDAQRADRRLDWHELAVALHGQSARLNAELNGPCMCSGALWRTTKRGSMSCQYALILLRWLRRPPEDFLTDDSRHVGDATLPEPGPDSRLRWDLPQVHLALNERRTDLRLTWSALADQLECTPSRLTNLRTARLADMALTMRVTQWLALPAAAFIHPARW